MKNFVLKQILTDEDFINFLIKILCTRLMFKKVKVQFVFMIGVRMMVNQFLVYISSIIIWILSKFIIFFMFPKKIIIFYTKVISPLFISIFLLAAIFGNLP